MNETNVSVSQTRIRLFPQQLPPANFLSVMGNEGKMARRLVEKVAGELMITREAFGIWGLPCASDLLQPGRGVGNRRT
jgi:hypothetical protein